MVVVVPLCSIKSCARKTAKSVFALIFSRLYLFSKVLIYSEFKTAEKSILTERDVAIDR